MEKIPPIRRNRLFYVVLLAVLVCLVLPVAGGEDDAGPPLNLTNATAPALDLSLAAAPALMAAPAGTHPRDWYVSPVPGDGNPHSYANITGLLNLTDLGEGDTVHIWGAAGHTYEGGIVIDKPDVTIQRWEGSPVRPLITSTNHTAAAFTVIADNATFRNLNISGNHLDGADVRGAGINATSTDFNTHLQRLTITNCTFAGNKVTGTDTDGGALSALYVDALLVEGTTFTNNTANWCGGGAYFSLCHAARLTGTTFTNNTAQYYGGGAYFSSCNAARLTGTTFTNNTAQYYGGGAYFITCYAATLTGTTFTGNSASGGGGAYFQNFNAATLTATTFTNNTAGQGGGGAYFVDCGEATLTNCRFDNPTNIFAENSDATTLNTVRTPGTNIAGGPYLGGNLWLQDPAQNISEWCADADFDGICDGALTINRNAGRVFGTDALPLVHGGTVEINATPADDAFVFVDGANTTRTANDAFYLPVGEHTIFVKKDGYLPGEKRITVTAGANDPLAFDLTEIIHPMDWYVSPVPGDGNFTNISAIPDLDAGDTVHLRGVEGHIYEGGVVIDKPDVTIQRWEGSPVRPLITNTSHTAPAFTVTADNATFRGLNISGNRLNDDNSRGAGINVTGDSGNHLKRLTVADCTFVGNEANGTSACGGALSARYVDDILMEGTAFSGNSADWGGGADFTGCDVVTLTGTSFIGNSARFGGGGADFTLSSDAALTATTFTNNTATDGGGAYFYFSRRATLADTNVTGNTAAEHGGGAYFLSSPAATLTGTAFDRNTAAEYGGGAYFEDSRAARVTDCRFDNPTNIFAHMSFGAVFNDARTPGANIAGGPYLGGNLWLQDPKQNISEWGTDADFDGICDEAQNIANRDPAFLFGTDFLPLMHGGGTVVINATSADGAFVFVDGMNTTRTANDAFYLTVGNHTVEVVGATTYGRASVDLSAGATERVTVEVSEVEIRGYAIPGQGFAPLDVSFDTWFPDPESDRHTWTFGDGNESSPCYWPHHTYEKAGTYTATLTAAWGEKSDLVTLVRTVNITVLEPSTPSSPGSHGGRSTDSAGSAGKIPAGGTASLMLPNSGIYEVRVTAGEEIQKILVTIGTTGRPSGVDAPAGSVYEYAEVTIYHTTDNAIEGVVFSFSVPKTWFDEHGLDPADVVLYRYHDGEWVALPTGVTGEDGTAWHFSARSPGFSLFAIGGDPSPVSTPAMTPAAPVETVETFVTSLPAGPTPAGTQTPFPTMLLVVGGAIVLLLVAVAVWRTR
ncbi:PGF-pre-PGF domain-containing protein [Methanofollis aquaemaris]|uniref:PGF-pre-PGF domain-containing protein n=1 Tax=Methanofollis aquaemaris TaxID=126734 RepID=A0A8A3S5L2_9EURY|nr:NosD domain-containing protein [Methanofollis aquaemaris]QSZ66990.1 PGF-pre-PGF domain-containing protein [Methanofollis aquaemaris]